MGRVTSLASFMTKSYLKTPLAFISDLIIPLVIFIIVHLSTEKGFESLIGILVAMSWSTGSFALSRKLALYKMWRLLDMFIASPIKPVELAVAAALAHLAILVIPATIVTIIAMFISGLLKLGVNILVLVFTVVLIIVSIIISWLLGIFFGLYIYSKLADPLRISSAANVLNLLLILLPPVIYPVSILPQSIQIGTVNLPLQLMSTLVPTVSLKLIALHLLGLNTNIPLHIPVIVTIVYFLVFSTLALRQRILGE